MDFTLILYFLLSNHFLLDILVDVLFGGMMTKENKERIIFKYNQLLESMINYKSHLKVADELEICVDIARFVEDLENICEITDISCITEAIVKIKSIDDLATIKTYVEFNIDINDDD